MFFFLFATLGSSYVNKKNPESWLVVQCSQGKKKSQFKFLYLDNVEGERDNIA